jgi:hypothetical protein
MPDFIYDVPTRTLAVWFSVATVALMLVGLLVIKPIMRLLLGTGPGFNDSISHATGGFGLFYGLLLGLLTVAAYQNSERVREGILSEATSLGALYADMNTYPEPMRSDMRAMLRDYVLFTIHKDWPAHRKGDFLNGGFNRSDAMRQQLARFEPSTRGEEIVHAEVVRAFQDFSNARQQRLNGVITEIPAVLWYAVLVGAGINLLLLILLKMRQVQHFVLGTLTAFFLGVILFVIVTLDRPLRGESGLDPGPFELLWERSMVWDEPLG